MWSLWLSVTCNSSWFFLIFSWLWHVLSTFKSSWWSINATMTPISTLCSSMKGKRYFQVAAGVLGVPTLRWQGRASHHSLMLSCAESVNAEYFAIYGHCIFWDKFLIMLIRGIRWHPVERNEKVSLGNETQVFPNGIPLNTTWDPPSDGLCLYEFWVALLNLSFCPTGWTFWSLVMHVTAWKLKSLSWKALKHCFLKGVGGANDNFTYHQWSSYDGVVPFPRTVLFETVVACGCLLCVTDTDRAETRLCRPIIFITVPEWIFQSRWLITRARLSHPYSKRWKEKIPATVHLGDGNPRAPKLRR